MDCRWMVVASSEATAINACRELDGWSVICFIREGSDTWTWPDPQAIAYILDQRPLQSALDPVAYMDARERDLGPFAFVGVRWQ